MSAFGRTSRLLVVFAVLTVVFLAVGAVGIAGWEYTNSDAFCSNACHEVHPEETYAHHMSQHASVACVECHIGRLSAFEAWPSRPPTLSMRGRSWSATSDP